MSVLTRNGKILVTPYTPLQMPDLKLYLSASRMYQYADSTSIPSMLDYSGNNYHANQGLVPDQPTFELAEFGIHAGLKFAVSPAYLSGGLNMLNNAEFVTYQVAFKMLSTTIDATIFKIDPYFAVSYIATYTGIGVYGKRILADSESTIIFPVIDTNSHLLQCVFGGGLVIVYLDGVKRGTFTQTAGNIENVNATNILVGGALSGSFSNSIINGISVATTYSNPSQIAAHYESYKRRGYL